MNEWGRKIQSKYRVAINQCKRDMELARESDEVNTLARYEELRRELSKMLAQEDAFWKQRAKVYWLRDGDLNTKLFHAVASARRKRSKISKLEHAGGNIVDDQAGMEDITKNYFESLFQPMQGEYDHVVEHVTVRVDEADNAKLIAPFTISEFRKAHSQMHSDKAPGPDGLNPAFYKKILRSLWYGGISSRCFLVREWLLPFFS